MGEPLRCPLATVQGPTTLSSSQAGLPGSCGHVPGAQPLAGPQDPALPLPAGPPSCSRWPSTHSPSPALSASHPLGPRRPSLALDAIAWALWETQGERVPLGIHSPQPRSHRSLFSTPHPPPHCTPLPRPPGLPQLPRQGAHWLTAAPVCRPLPSPGEVFCFTQGAAPTYTFLSKSICGPAQTSSVHGMMRVPGHSLPSCPGILVAKTCLSLLKWRIWQARAAWF